MGQEVRMWRNHLEKLLLTGAVGAMLWASPCGDAAGEFSGFRLGAP